MTAAGQVAPHISLQVSPIGLLVARLGIELYNDAPKYCLDGVMGWLIIRGSSGFGGPQGQGLARMPSGAATFTSACPALLQGLRAPSDHPLINPQDMPVS